MRVTRGATRAVPLGGVFVIGAVLVTGALSTAPMAAGSIDSDARTGRLPGVFVVDLLPESSSDPTHDPGEQAGDTGAFPDHIALFAVEPAGSATAPAGGFTICHDTSVPAPVMADVVDALETWSSTIELSGPTIAIDFRWTPLSSDSALGVAGPSEFVVDPQLPLPDIGYPIALANELLGSDRNGAGCGSDRSEMTLYLNSTAGGDGSLWSIGTDVANTNTIDLGAVVMHEVGHGLGIVSSARLVNDQIEWPRANSPTFVYDHWFGECARESVQGCDAEPVALPTSERESLRGTRLWFRASGGRSLELHAPADWSNGSSVSHLDEVRYPASSGFSLMTPYLRRGEAFAAIDPALQSLVQTLGWRLSQPPVAPTTVTAIAGNGRVDVTFDRPVLASGPPATGYRVIVSSGGRVIRQIDTLVGSLAVAGLTNGMVHEISVVAVNSAGSSVGAVPPVNRLIPLELPPFATAEAAAIQLQRDLLGDTPPDAEIAAVAGRLRSTSSLAAEAARLADDPRLERRLQVVRLYLGFFQREPDPAGLDYWFGEVGRGVSLDVVSSSFAIASEFERGQSVSDDTFIDAAYGRILGRSPDDAGRRYWLAELGRGLDRGQMLMLFSDSAEHVATTRVQANLLAVTFGMLGRPMTDAERAEFEAITTSTGAPGLAAHLASSTAYSDRHRPR